MAFAHRTTLHTQQRFEGELVGISTEGALNKLVRSIVMLGS